jgi:enoyl-CoA hydratase/carnithine racemase
MFPKPVVAAINGHAVAGGCMLVTACDSRVMASGKSKISLNEITFGSTVFAGSVEILRSCVGSRNAEKILYSGELFDADQALDLGLVDELASPDDVLTVARKTAADLAVGDPAAFSSLRELTRGPIAAIMRTREPDSIREFVEIWYSDATRCKLARIEIR